MDADSLRQLYDQLVLTASIQLKDLGQIDYSIIDLLDRILPYVRVKPK